MIGDINEKIEKWFTYHGPSDNDVICMSTIRNTARSLAYVIVGNTPPGADQTAALRKLRECVMMANAAIVCKE